MACSDAAIGVEKIAFYINKDVKFRRPDPSKENEINIITHEVGSVVIDAVNEYPKWEREIDYSGNYRPAFIDTFSFFLHGIENNVPDTLNVLRSTRYGFIAEIITTSSKSFVFPTPVFVNEKFTKQVNSHSWEVIMSYRVPTFRDYMIKLNNLLMINNYILTGDNNILGADESTPIVSK